MLTQAHMGHLTLTAHDPRREDMTKECRWPSGQDGFFFITFSWGGRGWQPGSAWNSWTTTSTTDINERRRGVQGQDKGLPSEWEEGVGMGALAASGASRFHPVK